MLHRNLFYLSFLLSLTIFLTILPASASLGVYKLNECVNIKTILNTSSVTISSISYPNSIIIERDKPMEKNSLTFNYTFCDTPYLGKYVYDYYDSEGNVYVNDFEVTREGTTVGEESNIVSWTLVALLGITVLLITLAFRQDDKTYRLFFIFLAIITFYFFIAITNSQIREFSTSTSLIELFDYFYWTYLAVGGIAAIGIFVDFIFRVIGGDK